MGSRESNTAGEALVKIAAGTDLRALQGAAVFLYQHRLTPGHVATLLKKTDCFSDSYLRITWIY